MHIGEFQLQNPKHLLAPEAFRIAEAGDMITHLYHGNLGQVIDESGKVLPVVRDAERRGVIFDLGFGGYNFSWDVAEKSFAQDLIPHTISSDLQQFNVVRPVKSLANVMSAMLRLGMTLPQVIERVTRNPAKAIVVDRSCRQPEARPSGRHHRVPRRYRRVRNHRLLHQGPQGREADRPAHHVQERQAVRRRSCDGPGGEQLVPPDRGRSCAGRGRNAHRSASAAS